MRTLLAMALGALLCLGAGCGEATVGRDDGADGDGDVDCDADADVDADADADGDAHADADGDPDAGEAGDADADGAGRDAEPDPDADLDDGATGGECATDDDCPEGERCMAACVGSGADGGVRCEGVCVPGALIPCDDDGDCPPSFVCGHFDDYCLPASCVVPPCETDADCADGTICRLSRCSWCNAGECVDVALLGCRP